MLSVGCWINYELLIINYGLYYEIGTHLIAIRTVYGAIGESWCLCVFVAILIKLILWLWIWVSEAILFN